MSVKFCLKVFSDVVADKNAKRYSDPELNAALGTADKLFVQAKTSNPNGTPTSINVAIESSNDQITWTPQTTAISAQPVSQSAPSVVFGSELGTSFVLGRYVRLSAQFTGTGGAYLEIWVTGRSLA